MLSIARNTTIGARHVARGINANPSKTSINKAVTSKPSSASPSYAARYYARWSKIIGRMSPEALAKMRNNAAGGGRQGHANIMIRTSNTVGDPWMKPRFSNPFAGKFWGDMLDWSKHLVMTYIASPWRVRSVSNQLKMERLSRGKIKEAVKETYIKYNKTLSTFQISSMGNYVSDAVMKDLRTKFGKTALPSGTRSTWDHSNLSVAILNYVVVQVPAPLNLHFIQVTVKITGNQKFIVKDTKGNVLLGKDEFSPIEDVWVVEKILEQPDSPWYVLATHLEHPDDAKKAIEAPK